MASIGTEKNGRRLTARCDTCGRNVRVIDPGTTTPWLTRHRMGKGADLRGGQTAWTICPGSLIGVKREATWLR